MSFQRQHWPVYRACKISVTERHEHSCVLRSSVHSSRDTEGTQHWSADDCRKEMCMYRMEYYSSFHNNMSEPNVHSNKLNKPGTDKHLMASLHWECENVKYRESWNKMVGMLLCQRTWKFRWKEESFKRYRTGELTNQIKTPITRCARLMIPQGPARARTDPSKAVLFPPSVLHDTGTPSLTHVSQTRTNNNYKDLF